MTNLNETFKPTTFTFLETDKSEVDGVHILGKVRGVGFIVEGASRNKRWYSKGLWEQAIKRSAEKVANRTMFGFLGHGASNEDENLGNAALIVTKLEIPESGNDGIIEYLIPATEAGKNLNALLRAGSKLSVSTRATGTSIGKDSKGNEKLDPNTYELHSIDIVQTPGVLKATPQLVEKDLGLDPENMENHMTDITIKKEEYEGLVASKASLEVKLEAALESASGVAAADEAVVAVEAKLVDANEAITTLEAAKVELEEAATKAAKDLDEAKAVSEAYDDLGSVEDIKSIFEAIAEMGTIESIKEAFDLMEADIASGKDNDADESIKAFAAEHKIDESIAAKLLDKFEEDEAAEMAKSFAPSKPALSESYRHKASAAGSLDEGAVEEHSAKHLIG